MRRQFFAEDEYYHIFNRGVDKRQVFSGIKDIKRFIKSIEQFNSTDAIGSIYKNSFKKDQKINPKKKLVEIIAYCLNPNHYHLLLKQVSNKGIERFMQKLIAGYTKYYNAKEKRTGPLFSGNYKFVHIKSDEQFLYASVYVNLNYKAHKLTKDLLKLSQSSWGEYIKGKTEGVCNKNIILDQFSDKEEYKNYCEDTLKIILENKKKNEEGENYLDLT